MGVDSVYSRLLVTHNKKSITNAIDFNVFNMQAVDTDIEYFEEGTGKSIKLGMVNTFSDVDYGQELRWEYEDGTTGVVMNPKGSDILEITRDGKNLFKGEHRWDVPMGYDDPSGLNEWKASDLYYKNVKDEDDVPLGSMLTVGSGSRMHLIYSKGNKFSSQLVHKMSGILFVKILMNAQRQKAKLLSAMQNYLCLTTHSNYGDVTLLSQNHYVSLICQIHLNC